MDLLDRVRSCTGFEWDDGNSTKNQRKHGVSRFEVEEVFFNEPLLIADDAAHSWGEDRLFGLGKTSRARLLFVAFTVRGELIRIISTRDMTKREREAYRAYGEAASIQD